MENNQEISNSEKEVETIKSNDEQKLSFIQKLKKMLPLFKFLGIFGGIIGLYYLTVALLNKDFFQFYVNAVASLSAFVLNILGNDAISAGSAIITPRYSLSLAFGCEGSEPMVIFLAGLVAFPMKFKYKLIGFVVGMSSLFFMNLFRIVGLYYIGLSYPDLFEMFHIQIFPIVFIFIAIILWSLWIKWSTNKLKI